MKNTLKRPLLTLAMISSLVLANMEKIQAQIAPILQLNAATGSVTKVNGTDYGKFKLFNAKNHSISSEIKGGVHLGPLRLGGVAKPSFMNTTTFNPGNSITSFEANKWGWGGFVGLGNPPEGGDCNSCDDNHVTVSVDVSYTAQGVDGQTSCGCNSDKIIHKEATKDKVLKIQFNIGHDVARLFFAIEKHTLDYFNQKNMKNTTLTLGLGIGFK